MRLHPHGAGRLQRRAVARRLGRAAFHGHDRRRRLAERSGSRLAAGGDRAQAHPRAGNRAWLLLRPQSRRHRAPEGLRRADLRPHRAQGRSDRHRDHQPAGGTGLAARRAPHRGPPRARSHPQRRRQRTRRRADARHAHRRAASGARARDAAGDRRRADHVPLSHAVRRQVLRRPGHGAARRPAAARHRDGAIPSDRPAWPAKARA